MSIGFPIIIFGVLGVILLAVIIGGAVIIGMQINDRNKKNRGE